MAYVWIASLIAACAAVTGIGCLVWSYIIPARAGTGYEQVGWLAGGVILIGLAALAGLVAGALWLIARLPH